MMSWLPVGLSFLSGLPESARKKRLLLPIQAFIDESGGKGQGPSFVLAGLIGDSQDWALFSDQWKDCLAAPPKIQRLKMRDAAKMRGNFKSFASWQERDNKIKALAQIINQFKFTAFHCTFDLDAFFEIMEPHTAKPMNDPYFFAFHITILGICYEILERKVLEKVEIIFDENMIFGPRANLWYPILRSLAEKELQSILPPNPIFKTDDDFVPLQAADMLAWLFRRSANNQPHSFGWIVDELKNIPMSAHSQFLTKERMGRITEEFYTKKFTKKVIGEYKKMIGK